MIKQAGSTLIVVLIVLLLILVIGAIAVKNSVLGLSLATSNQINNLLIQNNDAALADIKDPDKVVRNLAANGLFGFFDSSNYANSELTFCYRANQNEFFSIANASIAGSTAMGVSGFCRREANFFSSGREAVLSQVYLRKLPTDATSSQDPEQVDLLSGIYGGTTANAGSEAGVKYKLSATVISILPAFASATTAQINNCFRNNDSTTVESCFTGLGVPYNMQSTDFYASRGPEITVSTATGSATTSGSTTTSGSATTSGSTTTTP